MMRTATPWRLMAPGFLATLCLAALSLSLLAAQAQKSEALLQSAPAALPQATPEAVGMNATKLAEGIKLYRDAAQRDDIRGAVLYVARQGRVVLHEAVGWRNQENRAPMAKDTLFRMASNIKPLTAACILLLMDDGKLKLTDTAAKFLPAFDNDKSRAITIEQLLTHTSGMRIQEVFLPFADAEAHTLQVAVAKFGKVGPAAGPGTFSYSNAGYNTLGAIIEVVSGVPLEAFMKSRLYDPLGMTDTLNHEDPAKLERMATVYYGRHVDGKGSGKVEFMRGFTPGDPPAFPFIRASGGLITTASDYARFLEMYRLSGVYGGRRILKEGTVKAAIAGQASLGQVVGQSQSYGYGWLVGTTGNYSHDGSDGTLAWVDPAREIIGMIFTQSPGGNNPTAQFRRLMAEAVK